MRRVKYEPGLVLWRNISSPFSPECGLGAVEPVPIQQGSYMVRVLDTGQWCPEPEVYDGQRRAGITAFFNTAPPENWTHAFVVRASDRAINIVFGTPWSDYTDWRRAYAFYMENTDPGDTEKILAIARRMDPSPYLMAERGFKRVVSSAADSVVMLH